MEKIPQFEETPELFDENNQPVSAEEAKAIFAHMRKVVDESSLKASVKPSIEETGPANGARVIPFRKGREVLRQEPPQKTASVSEMRKSWTAEHEDRQDAYEEKFLNKKPE